MTRRISINYLLVFLLLSTAGGTATQVLSSVSTQDLKQTILVLDRARSNGVAEFRQATNAQSLTEVERKEFTTFLNYLGRRIHYYCEELKSSASSEDTRNLPCHYEETDRLPEFEELPPPPLETQTTGDEVVGLDNSLNAALGQFDAMLLDEQQRISSKKASQGAVVSGVSGSGKMQEKGSYSGKSSNQIGQGDQSSEGSKASSEGKQVNTTAGGVGSDNNQTKTAQGKNQNSMSDEDDIVARQLREAAEKETDPEIKEKLWEEYRKYKEGVN